MVEWRTATQNMGTPGNSGPSASKSSSTRQFARGSRRRIVEEVQARRWSPGRFDCAWGSRRPGPCGGSGRFFFRSERRWPSSLLLKAQPCASLRTVVARQEDKKITFTHEQIHPESSGAGSRPDAQVHRHRAT